MSDIELPARKPKFTPLDGSREHERLSVGSFFAEHKALVDGRRAPLQRLGMDPTHVQALTMPTGAEKPQVVGQPAVAFPIQAVEIDDQPLEGALPKKLPKEFEEAL